MATTKRLLIVEDDLNLVLALYRALSHTYKVDTARTAASGLKKALALPLDLIILDLNLPDSTGMKLTRKLREVGVNTPILVLSGESGLITKVDLLDGGANDYVTKPFSLAELKARVRVLLRQANYPARSVLSIGKLVLDPNRQEVLLDGLALHLRKKEFQILECLMQNSGLVVSRDYLKKYVWGERSASDNVIDVHVKLLRDRLGSAAVMIKTIHGTGYLLEPPKLKPGEP